MASSDKSRKIDCPRIGAICPHRISAKKICFVIMAYSELYSPIIEKALKNAVLKALKLKPVLAKDPKILGSTELFCTRVCRYIVESTSCIADVTYNNTNVGIEVATAHGLNKPVIITQYIPDRKKRRIKKEEKRVIEGLKKSGLIQYSTLPLKMASDLSGIFYIEYKDQKDLIQKLKEGMAVKS